MQRIIFFFLSLFLFVMKPCFAKIISIKSHSEVETLGANENVLFTFDVDETLIQPIDSYLVNEHTSCGKAFLANFITSHPDVKDWEELTAIILRDAKRPLIESRVIDKIQKVKSLGGKVIALTSMNTGKIGFYPRLEKWRYDHLRSLGFEGSFGEKIFSLRGFIRKPVFYKGILAADLEDKGKVLAKFLRTMDFKPKLIVAVDDDLVALNSIKRVCTQQSIEFIGYLYQGSRKVPWDDEVIHFQANYLIKNKRWLSDLEAKKIISEMLPQNCVD